MSSNFLDAGDIQRLDRETALTEQAPRQPIEEDRTPDEDTPAMVLIRALADLLSGREI